MPFLFRTLLAAPIFALGLFTVGCATEVGTSTGSITAGFTDGSTYSTDGPLVVANETSDLRVAGRLVEPTTQDELDLLIAIPKDDVDRRELDVDAELTLVRANAKKTVRVRVVLDGHHIDLKSEGAGSPVLSGSIDY